MSRAYYNEFDPAAAHVLRQLVADGVIAPGDVDERSIKEVRPDDLRGYTQCHFFAGGGLWSVAARLAGWPDERPLWTGSCPCQPFSNAHQGLGRADPRHLLPEWLRLIAACRPPVVMGEQVARAIAKGWYDELADGLEGLSYAHRAAIVPACAAEGRQERERLWFVANANGWHELVALRPSRNEKARGREGAVWTDQPAFLERTDAIPGRVDLLRIIGNAIDPQLAAEVIAAFLDAEADEHFRLTRHAAE